MKSHNLVLAVLACVFVVALLVRVVFVTPPDSTGLSGRIPSDLRNLWVIRSVAIEESKDVAYGLSSRDLPSEELLAVSSRALSRNLDEVRSFYANLRNLPWEYREVGGKAVQDESMQNTAVIVVIGAPDKFHYRGISAKGNLVAN